MDGLEGFATESGGRRLTAPEGFVLKAVAGHQAGWMLSELGRVHMFHSKSIPREVRGGVKADLGACLSSLVVCRPCQRFMTRPVQSGRGCPRP